MKNNKVGYKNLKKIVSVFVVVAVMATTVIIPTKALASTK